MPTRLLRPPVLAVVVSGCCAWLALAQPPAPFQPTAVLKGHTDPIYAVAVAPDGRTAATGSFDKTIKLWNLATGKEIRVLAGKAGHQNQVLSVAFAPDLSALASGGSDNVVKVWELPAPKATTTLEHAAAVTRVAVSPDGKTLAAAAANGTIKLWSTADGKPGPTLAGHAGPVVGLAFSPNNQTLVSAGADRTLRYWSAAKGELLASVGASAADLTGLAVNLPNGSIYTTSADGQLKFWPPQVTVPKALPTQAAGSTALALSPEGNVLVTALNDRSVRVVNTANGQQAHLFTGLPSAARTVAVAANGQLLAAGTEDGTVHVWGGDGKPRGSFHTHDGAVTAVALQANQQLPVTAGADGVVRTWGAIPTTIKPVAHPDAVTAITPLADGKRFATGSADKVVRMVTATAIEKQFAGHTAPVTAVAESGGNLLSGDAAGGLFAWTIASGQKTAVAPAGPKAAVTAIIPQPGTAGFAVVYADGTVQYRSVIAVKEEPKKDLKGKEKAKEKEKPKANPQDPKTFAHPAPVLAAAFTPDGKKLLTVSADRSLRAWTIETGKSDAPVPLGPASIKSAVFTVDRSKVLLGTESGGAFKLVVMPAAGGKPVLEAPLPGVPEGVAISPNATRLAAAVATKTGRTICVLDGASGRLLQTVPLANAPVPGLALLADNKTVAFGTGKQLEFTESAVTAAITAGPGNADHMTVLPGSGQVVTAGADKVVRLWEPTGQKEAKTFGPLPAAASALTGSRDGQALAAAAGKTVKVWTIADGKEQSLTAPADVKSLSFSPDRTKLLAGMADGAAWVYDLASGQPAQTAAAAGPVAGVAFHPSQPVFYVAGADKSVGVHPFVLAKLIADPAAIGKALAVTPNGSHLLTGGSGPGVAVWNAGSGAKERTIATDAPVAAVAVSKNGQLVAAAHGADVTLFNFADGAVVGRIKPGGAVSDLAFHPTAPVLVGALPDRALAWSIAFEAGQPLPPEFGKAVQDFPHGMPVKSVTITPDGTGVVTGADDKLARLWKVPSDQPKSLAHPNLVDSVAWDPAGKSLATGCHDGNLRIWDVAKGAATKTINAHTQPTPNPIYAVAWTPDGKQVATASFDKSIKFWDVESAKLVREIPGGTDRLPPDPKIARHAGVLIGSAGAGWLDAPPDPGHRDQVFTLSFTKDGKYLASGSSDRTVKVWEVATGRIVREFPNPTIKAPPLGQPHPSHPGFVHMVRFTPDGTKLVSAGTAPRGQGYLALWSVADGRLLAARELPVGPIYSFDLTPTGVLLGCGPKVRSQSESEALVVPLPLK